MGGGMRKAGRGMSMWKGVGARVEMVVMVGVEGKAELVAIIRKKRKKGYNISDIAKALELDMVYVKEVADLIDEDPARTDLQVAEILIRQS